MLTSLGAWMNLRGAWPHWQLKALNLTVEEWRHLAAMARDNYVRVVYKGYLFPFGHRASLIKVTERKFQPADKGSMKGRTSAYLRQRMFIVVRQPEMTYSGFGYNHEGREMPFKSVRITTLITPDLDKPENSDINGALQSAFWPRVGNDDFRFHLVAEDTEGQKCEFTIPLIFLENPIAKGDPEAPVPLTGATGDQTTALGNYLLLDERRTADLSGQKVAFAESKTLGDTSFETASIKFTAEIPGFSLGDDVAKFLPIVQRAQVDIPALKQILGTSTAAWVTFHDRYKNNAFDPGNNKGEVFVKLIDEAGTNDEYELNFGGNNQGDKVGGVITPNLNIQGISRVLGPVGGSHNSKIVDGIFDPVEFFQNADPKILGGIPLSDIIDLLTDSNDMPKFVQQQLPKELLTTYTWETTKLTVDDKNIFIPKSNASLTVNTVMRTKLPDVNADPEFEVTGSIKNFKMNLFGFIIISFDEFTFFTLNGRKPDVDVIMSQPDGIMFGGPLAFLNELKEYIPLDGFSDPPDLAVTPSGIKATYSLGLPDIAFGIFSLQNVSLDAGLAIPFNGDPARARFSFCERENPFLLTVSMFGGGGFAGLAVGLDGVEIVEASMEFGGCFAFDIGIASGAIYAFAGFYFKWGIQENGSEGVLLSAYFRMGGAVEVVGLICVSIELYLGMDYSNGAMAGQATLTITIDILVFSHSWAINVRREFAASPPPRFKDMTSLSHWQTYCETFA